MTTTSTDRGYIFEGGRTGVLLVHGLGGTPIEMRYVALALARAGHTVHVPQLAGHCGTADDIKKSVWRDWLGTLDATLTEMRKVCDVVIVAGLSAGGVLGLQLAADRPKDVQGVTLYAPTLWLDGWAVPWYAPFFRLVHSKWFANKIDFEECEPYGIKDRRLREMVVQSLHSGDSSQAGLYCTPGGTMLELRRLVQNLKPRLPAITQPALLIHPRDDDRASISNTFYLMKKLGGLVESVVLDDCYHIVTIDRQRDKVVEFTKSFVERVTASQQKIQANAEKRTAAA